MKITYYKSLLCPKCIPTNRLLARLRREHPEIEIEEIEVLANLSRALRDGITSLPTLILENQRYHDAQPLRALLAGNPPSLLKKDADDNRDY